MSKADLADSMPSVLGHPQVGVEYALIELRTCSASQPDHSNKWRSNELFK